MSSGIYRIKRTFISGLSHGEDIISEVEKVITQKEMTTAVLSVIGAVSSTAFGYYNQQGQQYEKISRDGPYEIISCFGNVSLKEERPVVHAHILFGDEEGRTFGGHLMSPTIIFAAELYMQELEGECLKREYDETTGLFLWR
jgi:predicted DNA-binding protein with PD1-like motif